MVDLFRGISIIVTDHVVERFRERIDPAPIGKGELVKLARYGQEPSNEELTLLGLREMVIRGSSNAEPPLFSVCRERDCVFLLAPKDDSTLLLITCLRRTQIMATKRRWRGR